MILNVNNLNNVICWQLLCRSRDDALNRRVAPRQNDATYIDLLYTRFWPKATVSKFVIVSLLHVLKLSFVAELLEKLCLSKSTSFPVNLSDGLWQK